MSSALSELGLILSGMGQGSDLSDGLAKASSNYMNYINTQKQQDEQRKFLEQQLQAKHQDMMQQINAQHQYLEQKENEQREIYSNLFKQHGMSEDEARAYAADPRTRYATANSLYEKLHAPAATEKPKLKPDYQLVADAKTGQLQAQIIPGSATDLQQKSEQKKLQDRTINATNLVDAELNNAEKASELLKSARPWDTGWFAKNALSHFGSSNANKIANLLHAVEANIVTDTIQDSREQSDKAGSLFGGHTTNMEAGFEKNRYGSLDQNQSPEMLLATLNKFIQHLHERRDRLTATIGQKKPASISDAEWQYMTPQERKLFSINGN